MPQDPLCPPAAVAGTHHKEVLRDLINWRRCEQRQQVPRCAAGPGAPSTHLPGAKADSKPCCAEPVCCSHQQHVAMCPHLC